MMVILYSFVSASLIAGLGMGARLHVLLTRFTRREASSLPSSLASIPTVTVCIPARNETHAMTQCLEQLVVSTYPKLEIIVLDDNSADNTSILIKSFAHAGVRFVEGAPLPEDWLGKNHAQQELFQRASGEYILFLDVDTHLSPHSIDAMVGLLLAEQATMVSVLPTRDDVWRASTLLATLRHLWSVLLHTKNHAATTSSAWLVERAYLEKNYEGLRALRMAVSPERIIASQVASQGKYRFLISTPNLGVSYEKKWRSQCETAVRLLYPFFGGSTLRALLGLLSLGVFLLPFALVPLGLLLGWTELHTISLVAAVVLVANYSMFTMRIWRRNWIIGGLLFPLILLQEAVLLLASMYAYYTNTVTWKGRPIRQTARRAAQR